MRRALAGLLLLAGCAAPPPAARGDLTVALTTLAATFRGDVGIYVRHLGTGDEIAIAADESFPTASLVKVPILAALCARIAAGELSWHQELVYERTRRYPGEDLLASFADGEKVALDKLVMLMLTMSDNTASLWLQELAGTGTTINTWLAANGFATTRVNSRTPGREEAQRQFGWGVTTPREMAELLVRIRAGTLVDPGASERMARCLARSFWDGEALSALPATVHALSKQGAVNRSRSEVVLVHAPHGDYVFCVITKNQRDESWQHDNEGFVLLREVSALLWRHFEPEQPPPAPADARFR